MEKAHQRPNRRHLTDLALEAVWIDQEPSELDADHAQALSRHGLGHASRNEAASERREG